MANILIWDLEMNKELDKSALSNIVGGQEDCGYLLYTMTGRTECLGTFLNANNEMVQKYRCFYYSIYEYSVEREQSFCGPVSNVTPC